MKIPGHYIFRLFLTLFSIFAFFWDSNYTDVLLFHVPQLLKVLSCLIHSFLSLYFSLNNFCWHIFKFMNSFLSYALTIRPSKKFISDTAFCVQHLHLTLLYFLSLCWNFPSVHAYCPSFPLDPFNMLIIVILKPLSDWYNIWVVLESDSIYYLSLDNFFFLCFCVIHNF